MRSCSKNNEGGGGLEELGMRALLVMQTVVGQSLVFLWHQTVTGRSDAALPKMHQMSVFYWIQTLWSATTFHLYHLGK